jgi:hypothetical protein
VARRVFLDSLTGLSYNRDKVNKRRRILLKGRAATLSVMMLAILLSLRTEVYCQDAVTKLKVVAEQANIRLKPDISSIIIRQVPKGTILDSTGKENEWFRVFLPSNHEKSVSGYVHESLVEPIEPLHKTKKRPEKIEERPTLPPRPETSEKTNRFLPYRFSLALMGGGNYLSGGDLNPGIQGLADLYGDILGTQPEGNSGPVHLGYSLDIQLLFPLSDQISWGIGLEFLQAKNESSVDYRQGSAFHILRMRPRLSALPISLFLSFSPISDVYVRAGISYYFARYSYLYQIQTDDSVREWEGKANGRNLGLAGGLGFLKNISPSLSFVAEATGRLIKIDGFKGRGTFKDEDGKILTEEGKLYSIQNQVSGQQTHTTLFIRETRPNEAGITEAREARINLSGISIRIGLRFYF